MNLTQYVLGKIAEEASEVAKAAMKAQTFGMTSKDPSSTTDNTQDIVNEFNDLLGAVTMLELVMGDLLPDLKSKEAVSRKISKILYMAESPIKDGHLVLKGDDAVIFNELLESYNVHKYKA